MPLASKIKAARFKLNLSQSQAAVKWGIPKQTLQKWEQEIQTPRGFALKTLEEMLDSILTPDAATTAAYEKAAANYGVNRTAAKLTDPASSESPASPEGPAVPSPRPRRKPKPTNAPDASKV